MSISLPAVPRVGEFMRWRDGRVYRVKAVYWTLPGAEMRAEVMLEKTEA